MLNPGGQGVWSHEDGTIVTRDTFTCSHCNSIVFCKATPGMPQPDVGGFCRLCCKHICGACADKGKCDPFEAKLERMERRARFLNAVE